MRKGMAQGLARPSFIDRNPIPKTFQYIGTVGPHTGTVRWTYTVPAGKKANCDFLRALFRRVVAATGASDAGYEFDYNTAFSGNAAVNYFSITDNTLQVPRLESVPNWGPMVASDVLSCQSFDSSTGGTIQYILVAKVTEFDQ